MVACAIKWSWDGKQPLDKCANPAVVQVQRKAYDAGTNRWGRMVRYDVTEWFPCCQAHADMLALPGMEHWHCQPLEA